MSQIINLKKKGDEERPEEKVREPLAPAVQPEPPAPPEAHIMQPQLVEYEADMLYHEWKAPEFTHHKKNKRWYMYAIGITATAVVLSIISGSGLTALVFGLSGAIVLFTAEHKPRDINFSITPMGVSAGEKHYDFSHLDSFWVHYTPDVQELSFKSKKMLSPFIKIPLGEQDPIHVRTMLSSYLPEERQEEELIDMILRRIKF